MAVARTPPGITRALIAILFATLPGCACSRPEIAEALNVPADPARAAEITGLYTVACPDLLTISIAGQPDLAGQSRVGPDGCIDMEDMGRLRVEGATPAAIADRISRVIGAGPGHVNVGIAEFASRQVYLIGPAEGEQRAVAYQGPETVTDYLRRCGGLSAGSAPNEVKVLRANVAAGRRPDSFPVDLEAILFRGDQSTDVRLQPGDQVIIGETRQSSVVRCLPPWMRFGSGSGSRVSGPEETNENR